HLASWAGQCPGNHESAGKRRSGKPRKGSKWLHTTLTESAKSASRSKGTYLSAQYGRLRGRRGPGKATGALRHSILIAAYHILEPENGAAGLELARTAKPDVIVLDLRLPDLDGWQVTDELRDDPGTSSIPLIFLTAHTDTATRERGLQLGAKAFITKPFDMNELV